MTSAQPQSISLSEAEIKETCDHTAKTKRLLLHAFYNASAEQKSDLEPNLKDLQDLLTLYEVISDVRKGLNKTKSTWVPRGHIAEIVRACCNQRYEEHDIESIFYKHGGINGLLVLHLGAKDHTPVYSKICALSIEMIAELAKQCGKEKINGAVPGWIDDYNRSRSTFAFFSPSRLSMTDVPSRVRSNGLPPSAISLRCDQAEAQESTIKYSIQDAYFVATWLTV